MCSRSSRFWRSPATVCQAQSVRDASRARRGSQRPGARPTGRLPSNQVLQLDLVLQLSDQAGLESFLKDLYDPTSPSYRHFLTPQEFTARFGPTQDDYDAVVRFAKTYGFQVVGGSRDSMDVQVKGSVATIETAFHVNMRTYQHPTENRAFFGPDSEPTLDLPFNLWHISGLDNYSIPHALLRKQRTTMRRHMASMRRRSSRTPPPAPAPRRRSSAATCAPPTTVAASPALAKSVGLFEYYGTDLADLKTYFSQCRPGRPIRRRHPLISTDGTSTAA